MLRRKSGIAFALFALLSPTLSFAQTAATAAKVYTAPPETIARIKEEGSKNSQVMPTLSYLTDVIGARLTGSPQLKRANEWTRDQMTKWGLQNAKLEAWGPFGRGWTLKDFDAEITAPYDIPLIAYPKAWSPSTKGAITADVVLFNPKTDADYEKYKGQLRGKIVLTSDLRPLDADFTGMGSRRTDDELAKLAALPDPSTAAPRQPGTPEQMQARIQGFLQGIKRANFLMQEGAAVLVDNSFRGSGGTLFVSGATVAQTIPADLTDFAAIRRTLLSAQDKAAESKMLPQMTMATEHYNRLVRMIQQGEKLKMTVNIQAEYNDNDPMSYNTVAEIPGTDPKLKDEVVMLGGHMDSWHAGTGATDNAAGVAVAMEAARIIQALGLKPRRTIRVALWSGEEQGLLGSQAYVKKHFGSAENPLPEFSKFGGYFNIDSGTGRVRGLSVFGPPEAATILREIVVPFADFGVAGAVNTRSRGLGGSDNTSFNAAGLPGIGVQQDPIEYGSHTWHTNLDTYERIVEDDVKKSAVMVATAVYQLAMRDELLPRYKQGEMPALPAR